MTAKDKLDNLRRSKEWHPEALAQLDEWQKQLDDLEIGRDFIELPQCKKLSEVLKQRIDNANNELLTNRDLTDKERDKIFNLKDISELMQATFSDDYYQNNIKLIEADIDTNI